MAGLPQHAPFGALQRAIQAYSYARALGYSTAEAERAAHNAYPGIDNAEVSEWTMPDVAAASAGARQAARAFGELTEAPPPEALPNAARSYGLGAGKSAPGGATFRTITATVVFSGGVGSGGQTRSGQRVRSIQLDVPVGMPFIDIRQAIIDAADEAVNGPEGGGEASVSSLYVNTVIGQ